MSDLDIIIESVVIQEIAKSVGEAHGENLALHIMKHEGHALKFILYEPVALMGIMDGSAYMEGKDGPEDLIVGYIRISNMDYDKCDRAWIVTNSAARKGYGPLMYDIAFSHISPDYLTADRQDVSKYASKVWNYYYGPRKSEFKIKPLGQNDNCANPNYNENDPVNFSYAMKAKKDFSSLVSRDKWLMSKLGSSNAYKAKEILDDMSGAFFDLKYEQG
jgi:hypothetical protein